MPQISTKSLSRSAAYAALLTAILFLCPLSVAAIPISEYQQNLKNAITALGTLAESDEDESSEDYENRFNQTLEGIRTALPRNQTVEFEGAVCNVDNSWLHKALDELEQVVDRPEKNKRISEMLQALETRVAERQDLGQPAQSKDEAKNRLQGILARPEYVTTAKGPNALTRLLRDFIEWLRKLFPRRQPAEPASLAWLNLIAKILVLVAALSLIYFLTRLLLSRFRRVRKIKPPKEQQARIVLGERLEPDQTATDLLSEAEALARSGDLRAAIRKAYIALLVELGDRKIISLAQHKTNRDYLNALRDLPPLHSRMRGLTDSFERHWYGFAEANQNDWQNFRDGYLSTLRSGN
jgi:hypothetical protein